MDGRNTATDDLGEALAALASGPRYRTLTCVIRSKAGGHVNEIHVMYRPPRHLRYEDPIAGTWSISTPEGWWRRFPHDRSVVTGGRTARTGQHGIEPAVAIVVTPYEMIDWTLPLTSAGRRPIGGRPGIVVEASWRDWSEPRPTAILVIDDRGLVVSARVVGHSPDADPPIDIELDGVVLDAEIDDSVFRWEPREGDVVEDWDADRSVWIAGPAEAAGLLPFPLLVPREAPDQVLVRLRHPFGGPLAGGPVAEYSVLEPLSEARISAEVRSLSASHWGRGARRRSASTADWQRVPGHPGLRRRLVGRPEAGSHSHRHLGFGDSEEFQVSVVAYGVEVVLACPSGFSRLYELADELRPFREIEVDLVSVEP